MLSDEPADKVIVCTIQKLGLALNENSKRNKSREKRGLTTYVDQLEGLRDKRIVFIFDECHRSQFGDNHQTIKDFFPKAQLFGFTGTPIFDENATIKQIARDDTNPDNDVQVLKTTEDLFQQSLHEYTITHAIEDRNVLKFHVDYFKPDGKNLPRQGQTLAKRAIVEAILAKHDAATGGRKFNAIFATASINDAIEYHRLFDEIQAQKQQTDVDFLPLNIAAVFSPPGDVSADVRQLQEDLPTELEDNQQEPDAKKAALSAIIASYNARFGTNHRLEEFDLYYQDVQQRIKDQQWPNADLHKANPGSAQHKIDITIVVDMLLTGFDSKYLNTLYVDKNLKHHGLIQAFSRTNRVLNDTKPYGHILDFRGQQDAVDAAIALFSGKKDEARAREIWLVDKAPVVIEKLQQAKLALQSFMQAYGLSGKPEEIAQLKGDEARIGFVKAFKDVQKLQTQLEQYTDLTPEQEITIQAILPPDELNAFRGQYLETARRLRDERASAGHQATNDKDDAITQLDFEFVLFASATIDYDYIMKLIADFSTKTPGKASMSREQLVSLIASDAKFIDERDDITEYVMSLKAGEGLDERAIRTGYLQFKALKAARELAELAARHGLTIAALQGFVDSVLERRIFDGEQLTELLAPLELGWKARTQKELALMSELVPMLKKRAGGRDISGLQAYED